MILHCIFRLFNVVLNSITGFLLGSLNVLVYDNS